MPKTKICSKSVNRIMEHSRDDRQTDKLTVSNQKTPIVACVTSDNTYNHEGNYPLIYFYGKTN